MEVRWKSQIKSHWRSLWFQKTWKVLPDQRSLPITRWSLVLVIYEIFWWRSTVRSYCGRHMCMTIQYPFTSKKILRHLQRPTTVSDKETSTLISLASYIESWKIFKENMSSQIPHLGMYKAAAQHSLLGCIFHQKYEIPYLPGYSLRRHCDGTGVMLPKKWTLGMWNTCAPLSYLTLKNNILTNVF